MVSDPASDETRMQEHGQLVQCVQALKEKFLQLNNDVREHQRVLATLEPLEEGRRAYRLVGDVLVEQTVGEVKPYLATTIAELQKTIGEFEAQIVARSKELAEFEAKYTPRPAAPKKHDYSWFAACQAGRLDEVKTKLGRMRTQRDNRPSGVGIYPGFTGLLYACLNGRIEVAQLLLEHEFAEYATEQADITLYGTSGSRTYTVTAGTTPLMLAILEGHMQIAMLFLDFATQNPDKIEQILCVRNQQGHCALMCLCMIQQSGLVEFLKKSSELVLRYEIELVSADGCTALQIAALYGRNFLLDSIFKVMFVREINSLDDMRLRIKFVTALLQRDNNNHDIFYHANDMQRGTAYNAEDSSKRTCSIIVLPVMQDVVKWILANPVEEAKAQLSSPLSRNNNTLMKHPLSSDLLVGMQPKDFQQNFCETKDLEVLEQANRIDCYRNYCQILKIEQNERLITQAKAYIVNGKFVGPEAQKFGQARDATAGVSKHRRDESELSGDTTNDSVRPPSVFMRMNQDGVLIIDNENGEERLALGVSNVDAPFDENFDEN